MKHKGLVEAPRRPFSAHLIQSVELRQKSQIWTPQCAVGATGPSPRGSLPPHTSSPSWMSAMLRPRPVTLLTQRSAVKTVGQLALNRLLAKVPVGTEAMPGASRLQLRDDPPPVTLPSALAKPWGITRVPV